MKKNIIMREKCSTNLDSNVTPNGRSHVTQAEWVAQTLHRWADPALAGLVGSVGRIARRTAVWAQAVRYAAEALKETVSFFRFQIL